MIQVASPPICFAYVLNDVQPWRSLRRRLVGFEHKIGMGVGTSILVTNPLLFTIVYTDIYLVPYL